MFLKHPNGADVNENMWDNPNHMCMIKKLQDVSFFFLLLLLQFGDEVWEGI